MSLSLPGIYRINAMSSDVLAIRCDFKALTYNVFGIWHYVLQFLSTDS